MKPFFELLNALVELSIITSSGSDPSSVTNVKMSVSWRFPRKKYLFFHIFNIELTRKRMKKEGEEEEKTGGRT